MQKFLLIYHGASGPMPSSQAEIDKVMQAWGAWMESVGDAMVDPGNPVGKSKTIMPDGKVENHGGSDPASGYSIISAKDIDDAVKKAKGCPHLADGGTVEVTPIIEMG